MMTIRDATRSDNEGLLSLTALTPMDGEISIRSDRQPDFFRLLDMRGNSHLVVAEDRGSIVGCLSITRVESHVDGGPEPVHYLGDMKTHPAYQKSGLAFRLVRALYRLPIAAEVDLVVAATAYGNDKVRTLFDGRAGLPRAQALGVFRIYQLLPSRRGSRLNTGTVQEEAESPDLLSFYNDHFRRYQFSPVLRPGSLQDARHLVARSDGAIHAAASLMDVGPARQHTLIRLPFALSALAACARAARRIAPVPNLPRENETVRTLSIRAMACRDGHEHALDGVIQKARNIAFAEGFHFLGVGAHERDPLARLLARYPKFSFKSLGFVLSLKRSDQELLRLTERVPYEDFSLF